MPPTTLPTLVQSAKRAAATLVPTYLRKKSRPSALPASAQSSTSTLVGDNESSSTEGSTSTGVINQLKRTDSNSSTSSLRNVPELGTKRKRTESQTDSTSRKKGRLPQDVEEIILREPAMSHDAPWMLPLSSENVQRRTVATLGDKEHRKLLQEHTPIPPPLTSRGLEPDPALRESPRAAMLSADTRASTLQNTNTPAAPPHPRGDRKGGQSIPVLPQISRHHESVVNTNTSSVSLLSYLSAEREASTRATHHSSIISPGQDASSAPGSPERRHISRPTSSLPSPSLTYSPSPLASMGNSIPETPAASNGKTTRVEIAFDDFAQEVFYPHGKQRSVDEVAGAIMSLPRWSAALERYANAARLRPLQRRSGRRRNRFVDMLNIISEEARRCGPELRVVHDIRYGRHDPEGGNNNTVVLPPVSNYGTSTTGGGGNEPWEDDPKAPCIGTIRQSSSEIPRSAWARTAFLVDVYTPITENSPRESPIGSIKRKAESDCSRPASPKRRRTSADPSRIEPAQPPAGGADLAPRHLRLSPVEKEHDWYLKRKIDTDLAALASRVFRETGNRRHVLGAQVKGMTIRFYLYDHAGVIFTTPLDLRTDSRRIIAAIVSITLLDAISLGLEPALAEESSLSPSDLLQTAAQSNICVSGISFYLQSVVHVGSLFERGCVVYHATPASPDGQGCPGNTSDSDIPEEIVLKMSWQLPSSNSEDKLLRLAAERGVQGIVRLYCSDVKGRLSDGLRGRLVPSSMYAECELRVQVTGPRAVPLTQVQDLDTFKTAFRSLVIAHHDLFEKAGILHRDVSVGNLMVNAGNHREGILIDLDIAAQVDSCGNPVEGSLPPAGTFPFRAWELVCPGRPLKAYYRHDLESFLYVLLWIQMRSANPSVASNDALDFGFQGTWERTKTQKEGFIISYNDPGSELPDMPLRDEWLAPLRALFGKALDAELVAFKNARRGKGTPLDDETMGGHITFCKFYRILQS